MIYRTGYYLKEIPAASWVYKEKTFWGGYREVSVVRITGCSFTDWVQFLATTWKLATI